jgi:hypothetical protein
VDAEQQTTHAHAQSRDTDQSIHGNSAPVARASVDGVPPSYFWANTVLASLGCAAGVIALFIVLFRLDDYSDRIQREERLRTQAIDEQRMENRYIARSLGVEGSDIQDHEISAILARLEKEHRR